MDAKFKSDKDAKAAFVQHLEENGFTDVQIVKAPSDIIAKKDGVQWYFEIKMTTHCDKYFGAATFTEWEQAFNTPDTYRFVIAIKNAIGFEFIELTPEEMMKYSTIPPCKVYFNLDIPAIKGQTTVKKRMSNRESKTIKLTPESFAIVSEAFNKLKK
ncbi:MAG: hypothetical protein IKU98_00465 [Bacteroidaceae bacterium]|nr:hypothetical protein [Bacteroidaceae bacterium]